MPLLEQVLENNPEKVKIVFKNFPLRRHKYATKAAMAALTADGQGKFWAFHDQLFEKYKQLSDQKIKDIARDLGFDMEKFEKQMKNPGNSGSNTTGYARWKPGRRQGDAHRFYWRTTFEELVAQRIPDS